MLLIANVQMSRPEDKGFLEMRFCDLPLQLPKDAALGTGAPSPMVF